jgi:hypothetical protein
MEDGRKRKRFGLRWDESCSNIISRDNIVSDKEKTQCKSAHHQAGPAV